MNPPYNSQPNSIPKCVKDGSNKIAYQIHTWTKSQQDGKSEPTKGFCYVNYIADCIGKDKNGNPRKGSKMLCLLPLACAIGSKDVVYEEKRKILHNNTLNAVFTLPSEMFYPGASANACCMVFTIGIPHFTKTIDENGKEIEVPRKETFFGYFKDDGFIKKKNIGRISKLDSENNPLWNNIEQYWLDLYLGNKTDKHLAVRKKVTAADEWLAEAYIETDYSKLSDKNFCKQLQKFFAYLVGHGYDFYDKFQNKKIFLKHENINVDLWKDYMLSDYFEIKGTKTTKIETLTEDYGVGEYPYVTTQATNNGVAGYYDYYTENGNVLVADSAVAGYVSYQHDNFSASDHVEKLIPKFTMNKYIAMFLVTILNCDNYRYSYGRKFNQDNIRNTVIKLPSKLKENGTYEPDWEYMENYIKSLPYSDLI